MEQNDDPSTWVNLRNPHWQVRNDQLLTALGVTNNRLPDDGIPITQIGNIRVQVLPKASKQSRRTIAECPECKKWVCAGHLDQHMKIHKKS
jgi:hypothetical protein